MTEKIARRGIRTPDEYLADVLDQVLVRDAATSHPVSIGGQKTIGEVRHLLAEGHTTASHQGFPVLDDLGTLIGLIMRRDISDPANFSDRKVCDIMRQPVRYVYDDCTVRQAADHMVTHEIGRLPVVTRESPHRLTGILTRSDVLSVFQKTLRESELQNPTLSFR